MKYWWGLGPASVQYTSGRKGRKRAPDIGERVQRTPCEVAPTTVLASVIVGCTPANGRIAQLAAITLPDRWQTGHHHRRAVPPLRRPFRVGLSGNGGFD